MKKITAILFFGILVNSIIAQVAPITGVGSGAVPQGFIPRFNGPNSITNSPMWFSGQGIRVDQGPLSSSGFTLNNTTPGGTKWSLWSTGNGSPNGPGNFTISDNTSGYNTRLLIDPSGNVGIGTTSPAFLLDVNGATHINGNLEVINPTLASLNLGGKIYAGSGKPTLSVAMLNSYDGANRGAFWAQTTSGSAYNSVIAVNNSATQAFTILNPTVTDLIGSPVFGLKEYFSVKGPGNTYIDGDITNGKLAGSGIRSVLVDANGKLIPGTAASTSVDWTVGGNAFSGNSTQIFGTTTFDHINVITDNKQRLKILNDGHFIFGYDPGGTFGDVDFNNKVADSKVTIGNFGSLNSTLLLSSPSRTTELTQDKNGIGHLKSGTSASMYNLMYFRDESILIGEPDPTNHPTYGELDINTKLTISTKTKIGYTAFPLKIINPTIGDPEKTVFEVLQNGETHIGTKLPPAPHNTSALLSVDGEIACRSLYVLKPGGWADFVFKDGNKESLAEVEKFIIENKHLPGVPSEGKILEEGYDINSMDAKLLEKIEKLYLHVIELEKEVKELKKNK